MWGAKGAYLDPFHSFFTQFSLGIKKSSSGQVLWTGHQMNLFQILLYQCLRPLQA